MVCHKTLWGKQKRLFLTLLTPRRVSVIFTLQTWLAESPAKRKTSAATPGYLNVGLAGKFLQIRFCHVTCMLILMQVMALMVVSVHSRLFKCSANHQQVLPATVSASSTDCPKP